MTNESAGLDRQWQVSQSSEVGALNSSVQSPVLNGFIMENGGLSVHPSTGELWGVESEFAICCGPGFARIHRIDPMTGASFSSVQLVGRLDKPG